VLDTSGTKAKISAADHVALVELAKEALEECVKAGLAASTDQINWKEPPPPEPTPKSYEEQVRDLEHQFAASLSAGR